MSDKIIENNQVTVIGEVVSEFTYSHEVFGEGFYMVELLVKRLSNSCDRIPVMISERLKDVPQDCRGRRKMAARREAADRDLGRVDMELHCVLADMQDSTGRIDQRLPAQRRLALLPTAGIIKDKDIVACLQKLHGDRVSLPRTAVGIAAARQDQHGRAGVEGGHFGGFLPQVADKRCAAGKGVGVALHGDSSIQ